MGKFKRFLTLAVAASALAIGVGGFMSLPRQSGVVKAAPKTLVTPINSFAELQASGADQTYVMGWGDSDLNGGIMFSGSVSSDKAAVSNDIAQWELLKVDINPDQTTKPNQFTLHSTDATAKYLKIYAKPKTKGFDYKTYYSTNDPNTPNDLYFDDAKCLIKGVGDAKSRFFGDAGKGAHTTIKNYSDGGIATYDPVKLYKFDGVAKATSIAVTLSKTSVSEGQEVIATAKVEPYNAVQEVTWSIGYGTLDEASKGAASIDQNGSILPSKAGQVYAVATAKDGTNVSGSALLTITGDALQSFVLTSGTPKVQFEGEKFNSQGLVFTETRATSGSKVVDHDNIVFTPSVIASDTTNVVATYLGKEVNIPITVGTLTKTILPMVEVELDKGAPSYDSYGSLTKIGHYDSITRDQFVITHNAGSKNVYYKGQMRLYSETDLRFHSLTERIVKVEITSSSGFALSETKVNPVGCTAVYNDLLTTLYPTAKDGSKFMLESKTTNRVDSITVYSYADLTAQNQADNFATYFLDPTDAECKDLAVTTYSWNIIKKAYNALSPEAKSILKNAPSTGGKDINKAVERYDYILKVYKYENFMDRPLLAGSNSIETNQINYIIIITSVSILAISLIAIFAISKRRRLNR